jgi:hypothetical protein
MYIYNNRSHKDKAVYRLSWPLAVIALLLTGAGYRTAASYLKIAANSTMVLPVGLSTFPVKIGDWVGENIPIPANIQRVAQNDDFLNRLYVNQTTNQWVNVYVAYSGQPRTMLGHCPEVCYAAGGWIHENSSKAQLLSSAGRTIPCLIHHFRKPAPQNDNIVVLNFYVLNGQLSSNEGGFSSLGWRSPNIGGTAARYVAQVQISAVLENSVRTATADMTDLILDFLPDSNGIVAAAKEQF